MGAGGISIADTPVADATVSTAVSAVAPAVATATPAARLTTVGLMSCLTKYPLSRAMWAATGPCWQPVPMISTEGDRVTHRPAQGNYRAASRVRVNPIA